MKYYVVYIDDAESFNYREFVEEGDARIFMEANGYKSYLIHGNLIDFDV